MEVLYSKTIHCVEHNGVIYFRWDEDCWKVQGDYGEIVELTEEEFELESLFQASKGQDDAKN